MQTGSYGSAEEGEDNGEGEYEGVVTGRGLGVL